MLLPEEWRGRGASLTDDALGYGYLYVEIEYNAVQNSMMYPLFLTLVFNYSVECFLQEP